MAGLPLKSGADFYNLEAARLRLHNLGADPTEVGAGLIYFNTSTGLNTSQKARLYTGSAWKTIAFSEDLDVAKNEDFLALQRRVDLLSGDVDTDAIINNMKEVSAFLEGFAEDASLMDLLNGKLNTSGGTINGNLLIGAPDNTSYRYLQFARSGYGSRINVADGDLYISFGGIDANGGLTATKVFSLGNNGIRYASDGKTYHDILHSGNVGEYNAGSANILASSYNENINYESYTTHLKLIKSTSGDYVANGFPAQYVSGLSVMSGYTGWQMVTYGDPASDMRPYFRAVGGEGDWQAWKQLAFTDSDITGNAAKLKSPSGLGYANADGSDVLFGYTTSQAAINTCLDGYNLYLRYGTGHSTGILLNSSGNVTIGTTADDGSGARLQVNGDIHVTGNIIADGEVSAGGAAEEGGNAGGGGAFYSDTIKEDTTQTTIAHGLGTDDIVVSIYEKDGVSGRWSLILTDVEIVDANNIIVSFGSATTVEHKVVIMGAVA